MCPGGGASGPHFRQASAVPDAPLSHDGDTPEKLGMPDTRANRRTSGQWVLTSQSATKASRFKSGLPLYHQICAKRPRDIKVNVCTAAFWLDVTAEWNSLSEQERAKYEQLVLDGRAAAESFIRAASLPPAICEGSVPSTPPRALTGPPHIPGVFQIARHFVDTTVQ